MPQGLSKRIKSLQFAFLSPDEIRRMSGAKIITADTYDDDGYPIEMGLMDLHLGVIEPNLRCRTCGGRVERVPRTLRDHRARDAGDPRRVREGDQAPAPVDVPRLRADAPRRAQPARRGRCRFGRPLPPAPRDPRIEGGARLPLLPRDPAPDRPRQADDVPRGLAQDHAEGGPRPPRADPGRGRPGPRPQPPVRPPGVDGPDRPARAAGPGPPVDHPRERRAQRGRSDAQARRRAADQPTAPREPRHGRSPARRRGPLGAPAVPRHDLLRQPDERHPARSAPLGPPAQDPRPAAQGKGRPVPLEPLGKAGQLLGAHGDQPRSVPFDQRGRRPGRGRAGPHRPARGDPAQPGGRQGARATRARAAGRRRRGSTAAASTTSSARTASGSR